MNPVRIVAVSDVLLDRAWFELGASLGQKRRSAAEEALLRAIRHAKASSADVFAVLGGLFDRRTVTPATLGQLTEALDAFPGLVVISPGDSDWFNEDSPYAIFDWPGRVFIFQDERTTKMDTQLGVTLWGHAFVSPTPLHANPSLAGVAGDGVNIALAQYSPSMQSGDRIDHGVTPIGSFDLKTAGISHTICGGEHPNIESPDWTSVGVAVPSIVGRPQTSQAVLIEISPDGGVVNRELLDLGASSLEFHDLDVTSLHTTAVLEAKLTRINKDALVRLTGCLKRGVLVPTFARDPENRRIHTEDLEYDIAAPRVDDQTATAEFERRVLEEPLSNADKHQAIALGLHALNRATYDADRVEGAPELE